MYAWFCFTNINHSRNVHTCTIFIFTPTKHADAYWYYACSTTHETCQWEERQRINKCNLSDQQDSPTASEQMSLCADITATIPLISHMYLYNHHRGNISIIMIKHLKHDQWLSYRGHNETDFTKCFTFKKKKVKKFTTVPLINILQTWSRHILTAQPSFINASSCLGKGVPLVFHHIDCLCLCLFSLQHHFGDKLSYL